MLTDEEIKSLTADQRAELLAKLQQTEVVVEEPIQAQLVVEPVETEPEVKVEELVVEANPAVTTEETPEIKAEPQSETAQYEQKVLDLENAFNERTTEFGAKYDDIAKKFDNVTAENAKIIKALEDEVKELKRTQPMGGFTPKPSETQISKAIEDRESVVNSFKKGYKAQL